MSVQAMETGERLHSVKEVSELRGVPVYQVRELVHFYELPYWQFRRSNGKMGRKMWLKLSDFDAALERTRKVIK
jgi:hypothetical protein